MQEKFMKLDKNKRIIIAGAIVLTICAIAISATYAFFKINIDKGETLSNIDAYAECLDINYGSINDIDLEYQYPITDEFALENVDPVTITVTNNCINNKTGIPYTLAITSLINDNSISDSAIRMYVKKQSGTNAEGVLVEKSYLSDASLITSGVAYDYLMADLNKRDDISTYTSRNTYMLDNSIIGNNTVITYNVYLWVDYYEGDAGAYTGAEHDTSYDGSTEGKGFASAVSLIVNDMDSYEIFNAPDITINVKTDGVEGVVPTTGLYAKNISCDQGGATYDPKYNRVVFSSVSSPATCTLNYQKDNSNYDTLIEVIQAEKTRTDINDGICSKSEYTTKSTCESNNGIWWGVYDENGLRYEGLQPNNYVWFNNEIWRIIGYVPTKDANGNATQLVKIIRNESIGGLTINLSSSTYVESRMYNLLNTYYYGRQDGTKSGYCYGYSSYGTTCNYETIGLNTISQNMIEPVQWAIGMQESASDVGTHYATEVGTYTTTSGGINLGLMNISDYGYSVIDDDCARDTSLGSYYTASCAGKAWLYGQGYEWTMSPHSSNSLWLVYTFGTASSNNASYGNSTRPVLYLDAGVYKISGSGTMADPYIIGM